MSDCQKSAYNIVEAVTSGIEIDGYCIVLANLQFNTANIIRISIMTAV